MYGTVIPQVGSLSARPAPPCITAHAPQPQACKCRVRSAARASRKTIAHSSTQSNGAEPTANAETSQERFISVSELLDEVKQLGDDFVFEDRDEATDVWGHEQRLRAQQPTEAAVPSGVKNALDPDQGNIVSAYSADQGFQETTVEDVHDSFERTQSSDALLLDVRTPQEYRAGHAPSAVNIELDVLSEAVKAETLKGWEDAPIFVICGSGKRSAQAVVRLTKVFDFKQAINVKGGMQAWTAAGYDVQTGGGLTLDAPPHML